MNQSGKKYDVIVIGELNIDLILDQIESFPETGKEKLAREMTFTLGSSSAIFASNLSSLGASVAFIGKTGKDIFGDFALQCLQQKKVDTSLILRSEALKTGATIGLNFGEDRAMVTYAGAMEHLSFNDISLDVLDQARHLHISSYFFQPALQENIADLFRIAKEKGLTTSFDIQTDPTDKWEINLASILPFTDVFLPNENELLAITGKETVEEAIDDIKDLVNILAVKLGSKGSACYHNHTVIHQSAFLHNELVDAIGAGDSFDAGFVFRFLQGASLAACQLFANHTGSYSTRAAGGTGAFEDINSFFKYANTISNSFRGAET